MFPKEKKFTCLCFITSLFCGASLRRCAEAWFQNHILAENLLENDVCSTFFPMVVIPRTGSQAHDFNCNNIHEKIVRF